jgi:hypothetical protein
VSNEERIEEIMYQAHMAGDVEEFHKLVNKYQSENQDRSISGKNVGLHKFSQLNPTKKIGLTRTDGSLVNQIH